MRSLKFDALNAETGTVIEVRTDEDFQREISAANGVTAPSLSDLCLRQQPTLLSWKSEPFAYTVPCSSAKSHLQEGHAAAHAITV